jgi:hypothetical protein
VGIQSSLFLWLHCAYRIAASWRNRAGVALKTLWRIGIRRRATVQWHWHTRAKTRRAEKWWRGGIGCALARVLAGCRIAQTLAAVNDMALARSHAPA